MPPLQGLGSRELPRGAVVGRVRLAPGGKRASFPELRRRSCAVPFVPCFSLIASSAFQRGVQPGECRAGEPAPMTRAHLNSHTDWSRETETWENSHPQTSFYNHAGNSDEPPCAQISARLIVKSAAVCSRYLKFNFFFFAFISMQIKVGHFGGKFLCRCQRLAHM